MAARKLPKTRNHKVSLKTAAKLTERHRQAVTKRTRGKKAAVGSGELGGLFMKEAVAALLQHPEAAYMRFYYGTTTKGARSLVLVASDASGNDLAETELDSHLPCPPFCATASLLRG